MTMLDALGLGGAPANSGDSGDSSLTPDAIAMRRKLAAALLAQGQQDTPIAAHSQGINRVLQSIIGSYRLADLDKEDKAGASAANSQIASVFGGGADKPASPVITPTAPATAPMPAPATPAQASAAAAGREPPVAPVAPASGGRLPMGMRVNNPGNIKYNPRLAYAGMTGPSQHTDQGDPQMTFDTPQNGMNAAARLALVKYARGQRTAADIVAGENGWTPGNMAAAANIARTMGVAPDEDLRLQEPARMAQFLQALTLQEHGQASKQYTPEMYQAAAAGTGKPAGPAPAAAAPGAPPPADLPPSAAGKLQKQAIALMKNPRNAALGRELLIKSALMEAPKLPNDVQEYEYDMRQRAANGQELVPFSEWQTTKKGKDETFSKNVIWGEDENGNAAIVQVSDRGRGTQTTLPPNVRVGKDPIKIDAGTHWILLDPVTRQNIGQIPKDVAGEARQKQIGEGEGKRLVAKPETMASVRSSLSGLDRLSEAADRLKGMPGLPSATGNLQGRSFVPTISQDTKDAETELETLKSQVAFTVLQAMRDASKTGGALGSIAVEELKMLQNNLASLDTLQGDDKFKQSLDAIRTYAEGAKQRLLRGYKDTYGEDFGGTAEAPPAATDQPPGGGRYQVLKVH